MKAIMYHYVREYDEAHPAFTFLDFGKFQKQLDYFGERFGFVEKQEWFDFTHSGKMPKTPGKILLTFDDAASCHYRNVFPELLKRNLWGLFYVSTLPYRSGKILDVHRIHLLCGALDGEILLNTALQLISEEMIPDSKRKAFTDKTYFNQKNYEGVTQFKRLLNYFISYKYREDVIDEVASVLKYQFGDAADFYIDLDSLSKMKQEGMIMGSHGDAHFVMSKLKPEEQLKDLQESFLFLEESGLADVKTYCHPHGGFHSFNSDTIRILGDLKVLYSFNVESCDIEENDFTSSMQHLPRYGCHQFAHGRAS